MNALDLLYQYSEYLEEHNYMDDDWWCEEPPAIERFLDSLKDKHHDIYRKVMRMRDINENT